MRISLLLLASLIHSICFSQSNNQATIYENRIYETSIRTVQLYDKKIRFNSSLEGAITSLGSSGLRLEFDDLVEDADYYYFRIIHCNVDWTKSRLNDIEFLYDFNEFQINDYDFSIDTKTPYVHYGATLPKVKLPGNYLVVVYREENPEDIVLSHRFIVVSNSISVFSENTISSGISQRKTNHQIEFVINYGNLQVNNPMEEIKVVLRQNQRWDNAITDLKPTFMRVDLSELEYRHFNFENNFEAGNEFRFMDLRSADFKGQNVAKIETTRIGIHAFLTKDKTRKGKPYTQPVNKDLNGQFVITNLDNQPNESSSEYMKTHFFLESLKRNQPIYLIGHFNNWKKDRKSMMKYSKDLGGYTNSMLLKQGWFNYMYHYAGEQNYEYEGSHTLTGNQYEVIVYLSKTGSRGDTIIAYRSFNTDPN